MGRIVAPAAIKTGTRQRVDSLSLPDDEDALSLSTFINRGIDRAIEVQEGVVVIKVPRADVPAARLADLIRHTRREARRWAASQGLQQYLAQVYDWNVDTDEPYMVIEFIPGVNGKDLVSQAGGRLEPMVAAHMSAQMFAAAYGCSEIDLLHGDIKPENVMMDGGKLRLLDLGLAKWARDEKETMDLTQDGAAKGTLAYISPFRFSSNPEDRKLDDLFAAAVTAHYWYTAEHPYVVNSSHNDDQQSFLLTMQLRSDLLQGRGWKRFDYGIDLFPDSEQNPPLRAYLDELGRVMTRLLNPAFLKMDVYGNGGEDFHKRYRAIVEWFKRRSSFQGIPTEDFALGRFSMSDVGVVPAANGNAAKALNGALKRASNDSKKNFLQPYFSGVSCSEEQYGDADVASFMQRLTGPLDPEYEEVGALVASLERGGSSDPFALTATHVGQSNGSAALAETCDALPAVPRRRLGGPVAWTLGATSAAVAALGIAWGTGVFSRTDRAESVPVVKTPAAGSGSADAVTGISSVSTEQVTQPLAPDTRPGTKYALTVALDDKGTGSLAWEGGRLEMINGRGSRINLASSSAGKEVSIPFDSFHFSSAVPSEKKFYMGMNIATEDQLRQIARMTFGVQSSVSGSRFITEVSSGDLIFVDISEVGALVIDRASGDVRSIAVGSLPQDHTLHQELWPLKDHVFDSVTDVSGKPYPTDPMHNADRSTAIWKNLFETGAIRQPVRIAKK